MSDPEITESWSRLHPVTPLLRSIQLLWLVALGAFTAGLKATPAALVLLAITLLVIVWNALQYLRFRYKITDDSLIITHGVLFRQRRVIPRTRIQNVDLHAGLLRQILGTTTARIETAGGGETEAALHVVGKREGIRLRHTLVSLPAVEVRSGLGDHGVSSLPLPDVATEAAAPPDAETRRLTPLDLAIAGATSNRVGVLIGALLGGDYLFEFVPTERLLGRFLPPDLVEPGAAVTSLAELAQRDIQAFLTGFAVLAVFFAIAGWGVAILTSVVRYFDFTLTRVGNQLQVRYGLFTRRESGFRRSRVQNVQIEEPILRRWLGLASLRVQTAGYGPGMKADERMEMLMPMARRSEIADYLRAVFPEFDWEGVEWRPSHPRARQRLFIRRALVVVVATAGLTAFIGPEGLALLVALAPAWLLATAHYRHLGHARSHSFVLAREGLWTRRTFVVPVRKIQTLRLRQTPFQRRLGLGTLAIETAGNPYEWHAPRTRDVGRDYGLELMETWAGDVTRTGLTF